jgi:hypothetical protein
LIEQPIHGDERLAGGQIRSWKRPMNGETAMQAEGDEEWFAYRVEVWQPASSDNHE